MHPGDIWWGGSRKLDSARDPKRGAFLHNFVVFVQNFVIFCKNLQTFAHFLHAFLVQNFQSQSCVNAIFQPFCYSGLWLDCLDSFFNDSPPIDWRNSPTAQCSGIVDAIFVKSLQ